MFAEVAVGTVQDRDNLQRLLDQWYSELRPTTPGFLGGFAGIGDDGTFVGIWRFASEVASHKTRAIADQAHWWAALLACLPNLERAGTSDVAMHGACRSAYGDFTQVIRSRVLDAGVYDNMLGQVNGHWTNLAAKRPEMIGRVSLRLPDDRLIDVIYFESEKAARVGEERHQSEATAGLLQVLAEVSSVDDYVNVHAPRLWW